MSISGQMKYKTSSHVIIAALLPIIMSKAAIGETGPASPVLTYPVELLVGKPLKNSRPVIEAIVDYKSKVQVRSDSRAMVKEVIVVNGGDIQEGATLVALDISDAHSKLQEAARRMATIEIDYKRSKIDFESAKKAATVKSRLFAKGVSAKSEKIAADAALDVARFHMESRALEVEKIKTEIKELEQTISRDSIKAPRSGRVSSLGFLPAGSTLQVGQGICTISSEGDVVVRASVSENDWSHFPEGKPVLISASDDFNEAKKGIVKSRAANRSNPPGGPPTFAVTIEFESGKSDGEPGKRLKVTPATTTDLASTVIPGIYLKRSGDRYFVIKKSDTGDVVPVEVKIARSTNTGVEIEDGLSEGETIILPGLLDSP